MDDQKYEYDENGFRVDLKDNPDVLHQPDADRSTWDLNVLDYDQTLAVLNGDTDIDPNFDFSDEVLDKIRADQPELKIDESIDAAIKDKYQQILLARYNVSQEENVTVDTNED
ncbi:MAG: hypothetical protein Q3961_01585 [Bifidobacteriaceae bacterium]|nr:hypothetical protein [Bifidobacteriaceae bacterium]